MRNNTNTERVSEYDVDGQNHNNNNWSDCADIENRPTFHYYIFHSKRKREREEKNHNNFSERQQFFFFSFRMLSLNCMYLTNKIVKWEK